MPAFAHYQPDAVVEAYRRNTMDFACNPFFYAGDYEALRCAAVVKEGHQIVRLMMQ